MNKKNSNLKYSDAKNEIAKMREKITQEALDKNPKDSNISRKIVTRSN